MQRPRRKQRRKSLPSLPRQRSRRGPGRPRTEAVDFSRYAKGTTGGPGDVPKECQAPDETGSADDFWVRTKQTERPLPEEETALDFRPLDPPAPDYGYGG